METLGNKIQQKSALKFYCNICDYGTSKKCNYDTHIISLKHHKNSKMETFGNKNQPIQPIQTSIIYPNHNTCEKCDKSFKNRSGLWKHKKKCLTKEDIIAIITNKTETKIDEQKELIQYLLKENSEFKHLMLEQNKTMTELAKKAGNNNTTSNVVNNKQNQKQS